MACRVPHGRFGEVRDHWAWGRETTKLQEEEGHSLVQDHGIFTMTLILLEHRALRTEQSKSHCPHFATLLFFPEHNRELRVHLLPLWFIDYLKINTKSRCYQAFVAVICGERCQDFTYAKPGKCSTCEQYPSTRDFFLIFVFI